MPRPRPTAIVQCTEPGCREVSMRVYDNRTEQREDSKSHKSYKCLKHARPSEVLSPERRTITTELVNQPGSMSLIKDKCFWGEPGLPRSGFVYGPGFKAFAGDFPIGTVLRITATVELPADPNMGGPPAEFAACAYRFADAMLLARDAQREEGK